MSHVSLRSLQEEDLPLLLAWRNNEKLYTWFREQDGVISWNEHVSWFENRPHSRKDYIILYQGRPVGSVYATELDSDCPEAGIYIGEIGLWGEGVATKGLKKLLQSFEKVGCWKACIRPENTGSIRLFEKLGFEDTGQYEAGDKVFKREATE